MYDKQAEAMFYDSKERELIRIRDARFVFSVKQSVTGILNCGNVKIYGLSDENIRLIADKAVYIKLYAGKNEHIGLIGAGDIVSVRRNFEEHTGVYINVAFLDGDSFVFSSINHTVEGNISLKQLVYECVNHSEVGINIGYLTDELTKIYVPRGVVLQGSPIDIVKRIAAKINAMVYIKYGFLYVVGKNEQVGTIVELDNDLFLERPYQVKDMLNISYDIDFNITAGRNAMHNNQIYKIMKVDINGDTQEKQWRLRAELKAL